MPPADEPAAAGTDPALDALEEEVSLICLRFFRGEWDLYLDYLGGGRVPEPQRLEALPVVQKLRNLDLRTDYLTHFLEDEVAANLGTLNFEALLRLWEMSLVFNPENDPFPAGSEGEDEGPASPTPDPSRSLH